MDRLPGDRDIAFAGGLGSPPTARPAMYEKVIAQYRRSHRDSPGLRGQPIILAAVADVFCRDASPAAVAALADGDGLMPSLWCGCIRRHRRQLRRNACRDTLARPRVRRVVGTSGSGLGREAWLPATDPVEGRADHGGLECPARDRRPEHRCRHRCAGRVTAYSSGHCRALANRTIVWAAEPRSRERGCEAGRLTQPSTIDRQRGKMRSVAAAQ